MTKTFKKVENTLEVEKPTTTVQTNTYSLDFLKKQRETIIEQKQREIEQRDAEIAEVDELISKCSEMGILENNINENADKI